jgi:hypothetical protein
MLKYILFFVFILTSIHGFSQGLEKNEVPREFLAHKKVAIPSIDKVNTTISMDSLAVRKWTLIGQSYQKLQYLRSNGLISREEFIDLKTHLLAKIQEYQVLLDSKEYIVIDK